MKYRLGYSPCPNDTYIFYAWTHGKVAPQLPVESHLHDVEELNGLALEGRFEFTKVSVAAYLYCADRYIALRSGGAAGKGVGPLVVAQRAISDMRGLKIASPGKMTTAHLLFQLRYGLECQVIPYRYDKIMPAVLSGEVDAGIIIHESRFTYAAMGLTAVVDLGNWWESETHKPLPLGLILARRDLGTDVVAQAQAATRSSLLYSDHHRAEIAPYLKANAIELEDKVIQSHIDLYVNDFTREIGCVGEDAVQELFVRATQMGLKTLSGSVFERQELFCAPDAMAEAHSGETQGWT
jgi:1,4-dihydroxy-6-naphthoate synthase